MRSERLRVSCAPRRQGSPPAPTLSLMAAGRRSRAMPARVKSMLRVLMAGAMLACLPLARPVLASASDAAPSPERPASASPPPPMAAPPGPAANAPSGPPRGAQAVREFLGLGPAPDAAAAKRGAPIFASNCAFCHGPQARGAEGPSLIYSELVLKDVHGATIADFLKAGRPEKGMPSFATLSDEQRKD